MNGSAMAAACHGGPSTSLQRDTAGTFEVERDCRFTLDRKLAQDQARRRHARARGDEHMLDIRHRVHRRPAQLPNPLGDAVHAVDVGLAELTAVGVDGQPPAHLDRAVGNEVLGFTATAESQLLQLNQRERGEVVVQNGSLNVVRRKTRLRPQLLTNQAHLGRPNSSR